MTEEVQALTQQLEAARQLLRAAGRQIDRLTADKERALMERDFSREVLRRARDWADLTLMPVRVVDRRLREAIQAYDVERQQGMRRLFPAAGQDAEEVTRPIYVSAGSREGDGS